MIPCCNTRLTRLADSVSSVALNTPPKEEAPKLRLDTFHKLKFLTQNSFSSHHQVGFSKLAIGDPLDRLLGVKPFRVCWWQSHLVLQTAFMTQFFSHTSYILPPNLLLVSHVNVLKHILCLPNQFISTQSFHNHGWGFFTGIHRVGKVCETRTSGDVGYAATVRPMKITAFVAF